MAGAPAQEEIDEPTGKFRLTRKNSLADRGRAIHSEATAVLISRCLGPKQSRTPFHIIGGSYLTARSEQAHLWPLAQIGRADGVRRPLHVRKPFALLLTAAATLGGWRLLLLRWPAALGGWRLLLRLWPAALGGWRLLLRL
jgi:hypothetical protein